MSTQTCPSCKARDLKEDFAYCPYCATKLPSLSGCPNCGHTETGSAKFCPECGTKLVAAGGAAVRDARDEPIPDTGITMEFGYSSSKNFDAAVEAAQGLPSYSKLGIGKDATHRVTVQAGEVDDCLDLVSYIRGWKSARIYVDGEKTTFDAVFGFIWCYQQRQASFRPDLYCFGYDSREQPNLWGCLMAQMPFSEYAQWWQWGRWLNNKGDWEFDKDRIRHSLQTNLYQYRFCPALQLSLVEEVLEALPSVVNPTKNKNWEFVEGWGSSASLGGLKVKIRRHGYVDEVVMVGVRPRGTAGLKEIIDRIKSHRLPSEVGREA